MKKTIQNPKNYAKKRLINRKKAFKKGIWAEKIVFLLLMLKGYRVLATRYKRSVGEVDLIAKKGNVLVFCEVKARKTDQEAAESITLKQRQRITRAAEYFVSEHKSYHDHAMRFDAILVSGLFSVRHVKAAWSA